MAFGSRKSNKQIDKLIKSRPKYEIQEEAFDNQAIARNAAFGRDRAIQMQEQQMEEDAATAVSDAKDVTTGTSSLLSTIAAIRANQSAQGRELAMGEAGLQSQRLSQLLAVNNQMIDEKDKAWNYNVNDPYNLKVARLRERLKRQQAVTDAFSGTAIAVGSSAATSGSQTSQNGGGESSGGNSGGLFGMLGSIFSDERIKTDIQNLEYGLEEVMNLRPTKFKYKGQDEEHLGFIAQDVQKVLPETVVEDGLLSIKMHELIPVLVKALQETQAQVQSLTEKIHSLTTV